MMPKVLKKRFYSNKSFQQDLYKLYLKNKGDDTKIIAILNFYYGNKRKLGLLFDNLKLDNYL